MLGGNQKFAGEGGLGRAALQGFFGGEADEVGIVVFLRNVREHQIARHSVEPVRIAKVFAYRMI